MRAVAVAIVEFAGSIAVTSVPEQPHTPSVRRRERDHVPVAEGITPPPGASPASTSDCAVAVDTCTAKQRAADRLAARPTTTGRRHPRARISFPVGKRVEMNQVIQSSLIDERDAVSEILEPTFRVTFIEAQQHDTYRLVGSLSQAQTWTQEQRDGRDYILYVEIPSDHEDAKFVVARLEGSVFE